MDTTRFALDLDPASTQREVVIDYLLTDAYWARWRTPDDIRTQMDSAWRVVNVIERSSGRQVGFARAFSDGVAVAYLADVYVHPDARGAGIGKAIVAAMIAEGPLMRWMLHTKDAHSLYERFGFARPDERYLERTEER